jgi:hypothetical protein
MKRIDIAQEADKWIRTDLKNRGGLVVLVEDASHGKLNSAQLFGGNWGMVMEVISTLMAQKPDLAMSIVALADEYRKGMQ